jgi:hypothetical protein
VPTLAPAGHTLSPVPTLRLTLPAETASFAATPTTQNHRDARGTIEPVQPQTTISPPPTESATFSTPSATPQGRLGPGWFPPGVNPLTGEIALDPALLDHRPVAVKVVNEPACARPQRGLNDAAVVFEHYVEAWGTRFTAVFYGQTAGTIGAVRSARLIDLELPAIFDALLVTSGSSGGVKTRLQASDFANRVIAYEWAPACPPLCLVPIETVPCADQEHTMFTRLNDLWAAAGARGLDRRPDLAGWAFTAQPLVRGAPATAVRVGCLNSPVDWRFDPGAAHYLRWQDGVRHVDADTNLRLTARNVVVVFAHHLYTDIRESTNFYSLEIQLWGRGPAVLFRDGQAFAGEWMRAERQGLFQLVDSAGQPLPLKPGRTWFELVALDSAVSAAGDVWTIDAAVLPPLTPAQP